MGKRGVKLFAITRYADVSVFLMNNELHVLGCSHGNLIASLIDKLGKK